MMSGTKITLTGADGAHYRVITGFSSRLIRFPDGITRHITLRNWEWEVADRVQRKNGWYDVGLPALAFEHAVDLCDDPALFDHQLRRSIASLLRVNMLRSMDYQYSVANDQYLSV
jgi:hypothetical protein